jgi:hypothetical protein
MRTKIMLVVVVAPLAFAAAAWSIGMSVPQGRGARAARQAPDRTSELPKCAFVTLRDGGLGIRCLPGYRPRYGLNAEPLGDGGEGIPVDVEILAVDAGGNET